MAKETFYDVLQVSPSADLEIIAAAHNSLARRFQPDNNLGNPDTENRLKIINRAYKILSDPVKREGYDAALVDVDEGQTNLTSAAMSTRKATVVPEAATTKDNTTADDFVQESGRSILSLYKATIGEKNTSYYITKFEQFDHKGPGLRASWNWPAFLFTGFWALYRKMYGWFFAFLGLIAISNLFEKAGTPGAWVVVLAAQIAFGIYATSIYHGHIKRKIAVAQLVVRDESKLYPRLQQKSGVHTWVIWVLGLGFVSSILASIAIPIYNDSRQPSPQQTQPSKVGGTDDLARYTDGSRFNFDFAAARASGYTDDQILKYLLNKDPQLKTYTDQGYSATEILDAMEQKSKKLP